MKLNAKNLTLIAILSALNVAVASLNKYLPRGPISLGHITIDAILCTIIFLSSVILTEKQGAASIIGIITGLLMIIIGGKPIAVISWLIRGLTFDLTLTHPKNYGFKWFALAAFLSFLLQTIIGKGLALTLTMNMEALMPSMKIVLLMAFLGGIISIIGAYITVKLTPTIKQLWGT